MAIRKAVECLELQVKILFTTIVLKRSRDVQSELERDIELLGLQSTNARLVALEQLWPLAKE